MMQKHLGCHEYNLFSGSEPSGEGLQPLFWSGFMIDDAAPIGVWRAKSARFSNIKTAIRALDELEGLAPYEFRAKYGCDCREESDGVDDGHNQS